MNAAKELLENVNSCIDNLDYTNNSDIRKLIQALECAMEGLEEISSYRAYFMGIKRPTSEAIKAQEAIDSINQICSQGE